MSVMSELAPKPQAAQTKTLYTVAYSASIGALSHEVNGLLLDGWQLQGGVSVATRDEGGADRHLFAQALVKAVPR